jgi:hypothetical protein
MEASSPTDLALVLLAAFWAGTSAVYGGIKDTNEVRDRIRSGKVGDKPLTRSDAWHAFLWDWAPLKLSLALISLVLCAIIVRLPKLSNESTGPFAMVCYIAAAMPGLGALFQLISFVADALQLRRIIRTIPQHHVK